MATLALAGPAGAAGVPRRAAPVAALATSGLGERGRLCGLAAGHRGRTRPMIDGAPNPFDWLWRYAMPAELTRWLAIKLEWPVLLLIAVGAVSLLARLRQARGRQRQQVKWLAYAAVLLAAAWWPAHLAPDRAKERHPLGTRPG